MENTRESGIQGRACVLYGGAIKLDIAFDKERDEGCIMLSELKKPVGVGSKIDKNAETYDPQVYLVFNKLQSIEIMRDALDILEYAFKHGVLKQLKQGVSDESPCDNEKGE